MKGTIVKNNTNKCPDDHRLYIADGSGSIYIRTARRDMLCLISYGSVSVGERVSTHYRMKPFYGKIELEEV